MVGAIGIDLGTTNSVVAYCDPGSAAGVPRVLNNRAGSQVTPSVVAFTRSGPVVGDEARELQAAGEPVAAFFKRSMGDPSFTFAAPQGPLSATDLSAILLSVLKQDAEAALGAPVQSAVITVPAYFKDLERGATLEAGAKAGLQVLQIINEPTAAAIAYGAALGSSPYKRLLVYDLGGGTFDLTILEMEGEEIRILGSGGDNRLGGKDWDDWIVSRAAELFEDEHGFNPLSEMETALELQMRAEAAKKKLSTARTTTLAFVHEGKRGSYEITRDEFEAGTAPLLDRTAAMTRHVLSDVGLTHALIDGALLVGGSTRMPAVARLIEQLFARPPLAGVNVDHVVAEGAAWQAAGHLIGRFDRLESKAHAGAGLRLIRAIDVTNHSLGMISIDPKGETYVNAKILAKNKAVPCADTRPFVLATRPGNRSRLEIFLTQGESSDPQDATYIGLYAADNVPHQKGGRAVIDITYSYDVGGKVVVTAAVRDGGPLDIKVEPPPNDVPERFRRPPPKAAEREHISVALAFDLSGSMSGPPLAEAQRAGHRFLQNLDLSSASMAVLGVADTTVVKQDLSQDARRIGHAIDALKIGEVGIGNGGDPFEEIRSMMRSVKGKRLAIVLADGVWSDQQKAIQRAHACHAEGIEIAAIGFGGADQNFLKQIASSDEVSIFTSQDQLGQVFSTIAQCIAETGGLRLAR